MRLWNDLVGQVLRELMFFIHFRYYPDRLSCIMLSFFLRGREGVGAAVAYDLRKGNTADLVAL